MFISVEKLIELGVMRRSFLSGNDPDWYVIYTADGAVDVNLSEIISE